MPPKKYRLLFENVSAIDLATANLGHSIDLQNALLEGYEYAREQVHKLKPLFEQHVKTEHMRELAPILEQRSKEVEAKALAEGKRAPKTFYTSKVGKMKEIEFPSLEAAKTHLQSKISPANVTHILENIQPGGEIKVPLVRRRAGKAQNLIFKAFQR